MASHKDHDIEMTKIVRSIRLPSAGVTSAESGGRINVASSKEDILIDDDGNVRRRWMPGDPWTKDYFFGGGDES